MLVYFRVRVAMCVTGLRSLYILDLCVLLLHSAYIVYDTVHLPYDF